MHEILTFFGLTRRPEPRTPVLSLALCLLIVFATLPSSLLSAPVGCETSQISTEWLADTPREDAFEEDTSNQEERVQEIEVDLASHADTAQKVSGTAISLPETVFSDLSFHLSCPIRGSPAIQHI